MQQIVTRALISFRSATPVTSVNETMFRASKSDATCLLAQGYFVRRDLVNETNPCPAVGFGKRQETLPIAYPQCGQEAAEARRGWSSGEADNRGRTSPRAGAPRSHCRSPGYAALASAVAVLAGVLSAVFQSVLPVSGFSAKIHKLPQSGNHCRECCK